MYRSGIEWPDLDDAMSDGAGTVADHVDRLLDGVCLDDGEARDGESRCEKRSWSRPHSGAFRIPNLYGITRDPHDDTRLTQLGIVGMRGQLHLVGGAVVTVLVAVADGHEDCHSPSLLRRPNSASHCAEGGMTVRVRDRREVVGSRGYAICRLACESVDWSGSGRTGCAVAR
jgi:hypothetical protein